MARTQGAGYNGRVPHLESGSDFGGYRIEGIAGKGGMGIVYRARDLALDRTVALKLISAELASDERFRQRFQREARLAASIRHAHAITIYAAGEQDGSLYIAMEYLEGEDLRTLIRREGRLEPTRAAELVNQLAGALDAAHAKGLVHRDVKPANVLIRRENGDEHAVLTDFGLTKATSSETGLTGSTGFVGTLDYIAPEQLDNSRVDARADVYSLGCVLFEALSGRVPYPRDSDPAKIWAHMSEPPPTLTEARDDLPAALDEVVRRAMAKKPGERYHSAGALGRAAIAAARGLTAPTEAESVATGDAAPATAVRRRRAPAAPRRRLAKWAVIAASGAGALAVLLVLAGGSEDSERPGGTKAAPPRPAVAATLPVGKEPGELAASDDVVWTANEGDSTVSQITSAGKVRRSRFRLSAGVRDIEYAGDLLWILTLDDTAIAVDPHAPAPRKRRPVDTEAVVDHRLGFVTDLAVSRDDVWLVAHDRGVVARFDAASGKRRATVRIPSAPDYIALGAGSAWILSSAADSLFRVDLETNEIVGSPIRVGSSPDHLTVENGQVWVANSGSDNVSRVDARTGKVSATVAVGKGPGGLAADGRSIWVANFDSDSVTRIDARSARVLGEPVQVGNGPHDVAVAAGSVWVGNVNENTVSRITPSAAR